MPTSATPKPVIRHIVEAMRTLAGPHPGFRPVHAKGLVCSGTFRASTEAPRVTRTPHFTGQAVPTIVRFAKTFGYDGASDMQKLFRDELHLRGVEALTEIAFAGIGRHHAIGTDREPGIEPRAAGAVESLRKYRAESIGDCGRRKRDDERA